MIKSLVVLVTLAFSVGASPSVESPARQISAVHHFSNSPENFEKRHSAVLHEVVPAVNTTLLGVSTDTSRLLAFEHSAGLSRPPAIMNAWTAENGDFAPVLSQVGRYRGTTPMISWGVSLIASRVTNGSQDAYLRKEALEIRGYALPVFIRLDWEMNGYWFPGWNLQNVTPGQYVNSWRHIVQIFRRTGASNAIFVWCPNVLDYFSKTGQRIDTSRWYPGDNFVDWIGLDAYPQSAPRRDLLDGQDGMNDAAHFSGVHRKPLMLAEWAPNFPNPDTASAISLVFGWQQAHPTVVRALVYFDFNTQGHDYTLVDHPVGAAEFRALTRERAAYTVYMKSALSA